MKRTQASLTERERQIMSLVRDGLTYGEIGTKLGLGYETIKTNATRLRTKLGLKRKSDLAVWAARNLRG